MSWYRKEDVMITSTPVYRDNIIDVRNLTLSGDVFSDHMSRRWSIAHLTDTGWHCKIISLSYDTDYDSFNLKPVEPLNKYLAGEYVTLMEKWQPLEWNPESWNGSVRMFNEQ